MTPMRKQSALVLSGLVVLIFGGGAAAQVDGFGPVFGDPVPSLSYLDGAASGYPVSGATVRFTSATAGALPATAPSSSATARTRSSTARSLAATDPSIFQDSLHARATFDSVWSRIRTTYWDPEMGGLDWEAVRAELRPRALGAETMAELRTVLDDMLSRLGQSHFAVIPGAREMLPNPDETGIAGPGVEIRWIAGELLVTRVEADSPAADAGIAPGWRIDVIDGSSTAELADSIAGAPAPVQTEDDLDRWLISAAHNLLRGPAGSRVPLGVTDGAGRDRHLHLERVEPEGELIEFGNLPPVPMAVEHRTERTPSGAEVGLIRLTSWFPAAAPLVAAALDDVRGAGGIVLDLRGNPGGVGGLVMGIGGHFLDEPVSLGTMSTRETELRFVVNPQRVDVRGERVQPFDGPVAILVDPLTASTSEIFAAGLQALGRAVVIGERTAGQALPSLVVPLPNGDRLLHAVADFTAPDGTRLEGRGVIPDIHVPLDRAVLLQAGDPALRAALRWLDSR